MSNPLVATARSDTTALTGIGLAESAQGLAQGVSDGSWVEAGLSGVGWLIEHVQPLKEALDRFAGDPPVIRSSSETWGDVAGEVGRIATVGVDQGHRGGGSGG